MKPFVLSVLIAVTTSCQNTEKNPNAEPVSIKSGKDSSNIKVRTFPNSLENKKIFVTNGKKIMYGGKDSLWNFDISNCALKDENFHYGIGREHFHALIKPEFITLNEALTDTSIKDTSRFLLVKINNDVRAYSIELLTHHEIVNDVVGGQPIMAAYCVLANLGAIYDRKIGEKTFTFGLSGYTYFDENIWNGLDGFVFWDRETESTWWPLIGESVSGQMLGTKLIEYDKNLWEDTRWKDIKEKYPNVKILAPGQKMPIPKNWKKYSEKEIIEIKSKLLDKNS